MTPRRTFWFRNNILIFAAVLAVQAAWLVTAESIRPKLPYFPQDKASEERASAARSAAVTAASIGWVRGDLWTDGAIALWSGLTSEVARGNAQMTAQWDHARAVAQRAARLSPHDTRIWLLLAALDSRFDSKNREVADQLKTSYFTGLNEFALAPLRIRIATRSTAITDAELQPLVAQEIRSIILRHQDQKPALMAAYRDASTDGKKFIEATVGDIDKNLLAAIRAGGGRQ